MSRDAQPIEAFLSAQVIFFSLFFFVQFTSFAYWIVLTVTFPVCRRDYTLQSIVFKMVPMLARTELERRQRFRSSAGIATDERYLQSFYAPADPISLSLEYAHP